MKDPLRLLDSGASDEERALLCAGASEEPPDSGKRRLAAALGLTSGVFSATANAAASQVTSSVLKAGASKTGLYWFSLLAATGLVTALATTVLTKKTTFMEAATTAAKTPSPPNLEQRAAVTSSTATPNAPAITEAPAKRASRPTSAHADRNAPVASKSIAGEIERLDTARQALGSGRPHDALQALDEYDRRYPTGTLRQEATLLRIEALSKAGDTASARRLADRFLRNNPRTPHEQRIRALLREAR